MIIELQRYGDFDMPYTHSVWENSSIDNFNKAFLGDIGNDREPDRVIKILKRLGFKEVKTIAIRIGGNY